MEQTSVTPPSKHICLGILAHVDAGKTTLSEGILYQTGTIRRLGRVDNRDAFLDTYELERARGITIFSKQAVFDLGQTRVTLLDTPGHVDFSAEMERTLQVLDCAVLVVSGADGVQGHTETLWRLLAHYRVPTFLFVNKMDQNGTDWKWVLADIRKRLDENCVPFNGLETKNGRVAAGRGPDSGAAAGWKTVLADMAARGEQSLEELAMCGEAVMEDYLENGDIGAEDIRRMIAGRQVFPCYFGSALKLWGVGELLAGIEDYGPGVTAAGVSGVMKQTARTGGAGNAAAGVCGAMKQTARTGGAGNTDAGGAAGTPAPGGAPGSSSASSASFGARVFKISRDEQGNRLTHMKITAGTLRVRDNLPVGEEEEKVNQIRIYSGAKFETVNEAGPGAVCAVTGPLLTFAGQRLGAEAERENRTPVLEPVLTYQVLLPPGADVHGTLRKLRQLEEEEPMLQIAWDEALGEIQVRVMGAVQIEILKSLIRERFGLSVEFGSGRIVYKETITAPVEGVGHFEPLRHYAEVHLLMEPGAPGSGLVFRSVCSTDSLDLNWQRLILTHLEEKQHPGVLTGAPITDMKITLIAGRAHLKHTEGGDFRQATYRAVRQGLREALSRGEYRLLEPYYQFRLEIPPDAAGRALSDLERMHASFEGPAAEGERSVITGTAPVATISNYQIEVAAYSKGQGKLFCWVEGYKPCHNEEEAAAAAGYDPDLDLDNPCGSVFCAHGAGYLVEWDRVKQYMHLESPVELAVRRRETSGTVRKETPPSAETAETAAVAPADTKSISGGKGSSAWGAEDRELEAIFTRTYGEPKRRLPAGTGTRRVSYDSRRPDVREPKEPEEEYLLVDGYNIIYAWEDLNELAQVTIDGARHRLMDMMCNYQGYTGCILILVFDAYKVEGNLGQALRYHNIHVVYTKEAETADQYIEKLAHQMGRRHRVTVATSDGLEQLIIRGEGCRLLSARDLREAVETVNEEIRAGHLQKFPVRNGNYLLNHADGETREYLEEIRLGKEGEYHGGKTDKK